MKKIFQILILLLIPVTIYAADSIIDSLQFQLSKTSDIDKKIDLLFELSNELAATDSSQAIQYCKQAIDLSRHYKTKEIEALINSGIVHYKTGNLQFAIRILQEVNSTLKPEEISVNKASIYKYLGHIYTDKYEYTKALSNYNEALEINKKLSLKPQISVLYYSLGTLYEQNEDYEIALDYFLRSLSIDKELNDKLGMALLYYNIGNMYELLAEYVKALESYYNCLAYNKELGNKESIADAYNVIGNIYQAMEDYDLALNYYEMYKQIQEELGSQSGLSVAYNNIGIIHDDKGDSKEALRYYFIANEIDTQADNKKGVSTTCNNIGIVYLDQKEYAKAIEYLRKSLLISEELNDSWAVANTSNNLAEVYLELSEYTKAFALVHKSLNLSESIKARDLKLESYDLFSKLYSRMDNYKKALEYYQKHTALKDTLFTTSIKEIAKFQRVHELKEGEKENELLRKNNRIKDLLIEKQNIFRLFLLIVIIAVCVLVILIYKRYSDKKAENEVIREQHEQISSQKDQLDNTLDELNVSNNHLKKTVNELQISHKRIQILNKILRHDLANDFAVVKSCIRLNRRRPDEEMLDEVEKRADKSLKTIRRLRDQESFIDAHTHLKEMSITDVLNSVISEYPQLDFTVQGNGFVFADEAIYSVFENLVSNAIKHGKSNKIEFLISDNDTFLAIKVSDFGSGVPDEIKDYIFDEGYFHGCEGNTGIGLYIVKQTIEGFGGVISVEDNSPQGATFIINLRKTVKF